MAGDWTNGVLADLCESVDYGYTASAANDPSVGPKFLRITDIRQDGLRWDNVPHVEIPPEKFEKYSLRAGDIVVARTGAFTGANAYVVPPVPAVFASYLVRLKAGPRLDSRFAYFFMQSDAYREHVAGVLGGSAQPNASAKALTRVEMPVPPLHEQRRIAAVLGALDDKIELNRKMNRTLEEMAQAIFKSWFIDFDGHDDLVDSEIGPVPRGWEVGGIDTVAGNVRDTVDPRGLPDHTAYVGLEHVPRRCVALDTWGRASDAGSTKTRFQRGDVLFGKLRPYFHKVVPAPIDGVCSTDILVIRPEHEDWHWYAFGHLYSDSMIAHTTAAADGTKMPRTNWKDLCRFSVAIPPKELAAEYGRSVTPMFDQIGANVKECRTLATLRDTLLPKLISGELRVPEALELVEAAS